ncbi:hypothetical protein [Nitratiruptor sp. YY09-18]|uniref:hypothetical protein n=1 Tax=Nitratiruptor sp. YY09-18 TaxID=2724901 RepID=UPI0019164AB2|nr:hypothetical protein [Nitratiruptor sp. YY09-18]BCD67923.1 hypothetical protein NitYY0918_C0830 [Nitratiruptor sp. YY09-18]
MKNFFFVAFFLDILLIIYAFFSSPYFLLNSQLGFIAALLVIMGSFYGYKRFIQARQNSQKTDIIDTIEDRFDLYSEETHEERSAKELFEEERAKSKAKGAGLKHFLSTAPGFFSPYRLFGYLFLVVAVLVLIRKNLFEPWSFLAGLSVVPVSVILFALFASRSSQDQSSI